MKRIGQSANGRFLPLADIFTSAMASILLLFVVSSRLENIEPQRIPQSDIVYRCLRVPEADGGYALVQFWPKAGAAVPVETFGDELRKLSVAGRLSVRVLVEDPGAVAGPCAKRADEIAKQVNRSFDAVAAADRPRSYVMLDVASPAPPANVTP